MGLTRITQYTHRPNVTELGLGNTHECYMLVGTDYDMSSIFPPGVNVSIHNAFSTKTYILKSSNYREFRINQMGDIYRDYKVTPGDEIIISQIKKNNSCDLYFNINNYNRVVLLVKKGLAEINNIDRLKPYEKSINEYEVIINDSGRISILKISFDSSKAKRADSPNTTDYYNVIVNGDKMPNGTYYLSLSADKNILDNLPKSDFNTVEFDDKKLLTMGASIKKSKITDSFQRIYFGAPGTGKSFELKRITQGYSTIRTTFHPDSDYSTFVGTYKPTMKTVNFRDLSGHIVEGVQEERIVYTYVKQSFLKAYLAAWQKYAKASEITEPQFLVIEEINRGNCAQIFGDLFQLLDRNDNGFSTYPIEADSDLQKEIAKAFSANGEFPIENGFDVDSVVENYTSNYDETLSDDIKNGRVLLLPNNLFIWATMNTSDQSLFPIDSAFKRRWDWKYVKITDAGKGWKINCGNEYCDWWKFIEEINKKIAKETNSDDKKLGYFFCKPQEGSDKISEEKFVSKVLFYLWNDVFKDGDISLFKVSDDENEETCFDAFYDKNNKVNVNAVKTFLIGVIGESNIYLSEDVPLLEDDGENENTIDYTKYSFDGKSRLSKKELGYSIVMKYINEHNDKTFIELQENLSFDKSVDNKYRYKGILARSGDVIGSYTSCFGEELMSMDGVKYKVLTWWNKYNIDFIIKFAEAQGWIVKKETE